MAFRKVTAALFGIATAGVTASVASAESKRGYVPKFVDSEHHKSTQEQTGEAAAADRTRRFDSIERKLRTYSKIPDETMEEMRAGRRKQALGYVSSLANMLMDVSRDEGASPFMDMAVEEACEGIIKGEGGPFGAVIVQGDLVVARAHNTVLQTNDPTAHAEVTCIRKAAARLGRFDLSDCELYTSCEPCPMCYGAIHWAKIPKCYYAATAKDAAEAGFDDQFIYDAIRNKTSEEYCEFIHQKHVGAVDVFKANYELY